MQLHCEISDYGSTTGRVCVSRLGASPPHLPKGRTWRRLPDRAFRSHWLLQGFPQTVTQRVVERGFVILEPEQSMQPL